MLRSFGLHFPFLLRCTLPCLIAMALLHQAALACSVPVFRYGLEHWKADPYRLVVAHHGVLSGSSQALVQQLKDAAAGANAAVQVVNLAQSPPPGLKAAWESAGSPSEPTLIILAPTTALTPGAVWSGPLSATNISSALDSPARKSIATRLGEGESAVWVLLESGDKSADDAAASLLEARLAYLSTVMELPKLDEQDIRNGLVSLPPDGLHLSFSIVRVSRTDPAEHIFTQMLLATEPDLKEVEAPMAFPVFGQGRALYALMGKGIKHETIDEAANFLIGSCSCQIKEKNPGADLLMAVDWKELLRDQATGLTDLPPASEITKSGQPETVTIAPTLADAKDGPPLGSVKVNHLPGRTFSSVNRVGLLNSTVIIGAGVVICLLVVLGLFVMFKRKQ